MRQGPVMILLALAIVLTGSCGNDRQTVTIAIPGDASHKSRALLMLQQLGYLRLKHQAGLTVSCSDIDDNPCGIHFREIPMQQLPMVLNEVDFAVMPSGVAMSAGLPLRQKAIAVGSLSDYGNIIAVKEGMELTPEVKAVVAALRSKAVADFIVEAYGGGVVSVVKRPGDGFDSTVDYQALTGKTLPVATVAFPHAEILKVVASLLERKKITLEIHICETSADANAAVMDGTVVANYCQHFLDVLEYNQQKDARLVSCGEIHTEPLGLYPGISKSLSLLNQ